MKPITASISIILLSLFTIITSHAQSQEDFTGALLWKVSGNGLTEPSYILGTHHLTSINILDSIPGLRDVIENSKQTVGEVIVPDDQAIMITKFQAASAMPEGQTYEKLLSPEDYKILDNGLITNIGVGLDNLGQFKPGVISSMYTIMNYAKYNPQYDIASHQPVDIYLQKIARDKGKEVLGLETIEDQIYIMFDAEPLKEQAESLVCKIKNNTETKETYDLVDNYYRNGELAKLYDFSKNNTDDRCPISKTLFEALGKTRNDKWLAKLPQMIKDKSTLVAVGALHLAGEEGLLFQLHKLGYTVEPVK